MDEVSIEQARRTLGEIVDRARLAGQFTTITRQGKPAAMVVSVEWHSVLATERIGAALEIARSYDDADGEVINQMVRALTGDTADRLKGSPRSAPGSS